MVFLFCVGLPCVLTQPLTFLAQQNRTRGGKLGGDGSGRMSQHGVLWLGLTQLLGRGGMAAGPQGQAGGPKRGFYEASLLRDGEEQKKAKIESFHLLN